MLIIGRRLLKDLYIITITTPEARKMKNKFISTICLVILSAAYAIQGRSQNLVYNPDFEEISQCPVAPDQIHFAIGWTTANSMNVELMHECATTGFSSSIAVPLSNKGYQEARSGQAYAGLYAYPYSSGNNNAYEYLQTELVETLGENISYFVEFYASPEDRTEFGLGFSDGLGLSFSDTALLDSNTPRGLIEREAAVEYIGQVLDDTLGWTPIRGAYVAQGNEKFLTIGNFNLHSKTLFEIDTPSSSLNANYFFIDDVSVIPYNPLPDTLFLCENEILFLDGSFSRGTGYRWNTGETTNQIEVSSPGLYQIEVSVDTVKLWDETEVIFIPDEEESLLLDTMVCEGGELSLKAPFPGNYRWSTGEVSSILNVVESGSYELQIENDCGFFDFSYEADFIPCRCDVFVPNAFSPNLDGVNDFFEPFFGCNLEYSIEGMEVFDRWGGKIYSSKDSASISWNGTNKGVPLPGGEYIWYLKYVVVSPVSGEEEQVVKKGSVLLVL